MKTLPGFIEAMNVAVDLDTFDEYNVSSEYTRGITELIITMYVREDPDPGSGEARDLIETLGKTLHQLNH